MFRYAFTEEAEFAKVEAAFRNDEPVVSSRSHRKESGIGRRCVLAGAGSLAVELRQGRPPSHRCGGHARALVAFPYSVAVGRGFCSPSAECGRGYGISAIPVMSQSACAFPKMPIKNFAEKLMNDADRLYQVGNLYLLDITPFSHLREICELEDMNEWKTQLCGARFSCC